MALDMGQYGFMRVPDRAHKPLETNLEIHIFSSKMISYLLVARLKPLFLYIRNGSGHQKHTNILLLAAAVRAVDREFVLYIGAVLGRLGAVVKLSGATWAILGRSWAILGRSVGKVKIRSPFSGKNGLLHCFFTIIGARPELIPRIPRIPRKRCQEPQSRPSQTRAGVLG